MHINIVTRADVTRECNEVLFSELEALLSKVSFNIRHCNTVSALPLRYDYHLILGVTVFGVEAYFGVHGERHVIVDLEKKINHFLPSLQ